ncbi:MAG: FAD-binding oxidoreductase [Roseiflexaceae bacterium]|nr:FAD-binding oxidoreductase [Roseiflexaceae bacterium]
MTITIIGAGVSGISTAIRLLEAGHAVQIWARDLPPHTTSNVAAAVWYPYKAYPEDLVLGWAAATFSAFGALERQPKAGVMLREGIELFPYQVDDPWWRAAVPLFRRAGPTELPDGYAAGYIFAAHVIEMDVYLPFLLGRVTELGGMLVQRPIERLAEAFAESDVVVNCAGLGARELLPDPAMQPIRGQIVRVAQVGLERFIFDDHGPGGVTYLVPRSQDIILGGVAEAGSEQLAPDPATAAAIIERCTALEPRLRGATVLEHRVGLRPGRPSVRLEREAYAPGKILIHNYGHGGAGVTLSWGCAAAVQELLNV